MMPKLNIELDALGTNWLIESSEVLEKRQRIIQELDEVTRVWSRFQDNTVVMQMAQSAGVYTFSKRDSELLAWYHQLYEATQGLVTPLIGQTLVDAGYDKDYSLMPLETISLAPKWDNVLSLDGNNLTLLKPAMIDVGAAGKGYAVDRVAALLSGEYCVDASGDIVVSGPEVRIGLQDPRDSSKLIGIATIQDESICGSATTERVWGQWHHIINPKTAKPVSDIIAVWVIAKQAMHADGLATALFFVHPDTLKKRINFDYCIIYQDGRVHVSNQKKIELFRKGDT
jgi:thiamine biosynthesis lipoprotein